MKTTQQILLTAVLLFVTTTLGTTNAETIVFNNGGGGTMTTGDDLDGIVPGDLPATVTATEAPIDITITGLTASGTDVTGATLNSTGNSLGIDAGGVFSAGGDDADVLDSALSESISLQFSESVVITQVDFDNFEDGEVFDFAGQTVTFADISGGNLDLYNVPGPGIAIPANTSFTLSATTGSVGLDAVTLTIVAIPEPTSALLITLGATLFGRRRKNG